MAEFDKRLDLLKNIIDNKDKIFEKINEEKEKLIPIVNITNILGCATDEVKNSSLLHNILKIKFKYENKEINFAKDFSEFIIKEKLKNDSVSINSTAETYNEFYASSETWRRIDLFIHSDNFEIIIENKIWAGDQPNQLKDYYNNRVNENKNNDKIKDNIFIVYLTRNRDKPSEFSIDRELIAELENKNKICYLSHDDIAEWIKNDILNKYQFLKDEKFQLIYSALIQIAYNEKYISKKTEENKMEQKIIKDFLNLNSLINNIEGLENKSKELNEYIKLFENTIETIKNKKKDILLEDEIIRNDIKYSIDIGNYLKEKRINAMIFSNEEQIINKFSPTLYSENIIIPIMGYDFRIILMQHFHALSINIFCTKNNIIDKLKEKDFKEKIATIFNGSYEEGIDGEYVYVYYQDIYTTEKGCPKAEDTAQKMIDLYKLLEKITQ